MSRCEMYVGDISLGDLYLGDLSSDYAHRPVRDTRLARDDLNTPGAVILDGDLDRTIEPFLPPVPDNPA